MCVLSVKGLVLGDTQAHMCRSCTHAHSSSAWAEAHAHVGDGVAGGVGCGGTMAEVAAVGAAAASGVLLAVSRELAAAAASAMHTVSW